MMLDAININRSRFTKWAEEWLTIPRAMYYGGYIRDMFMTDIFDLLLEQKVFTPCELLADLSSKKVYIPKEIKKYIQEYTEERDERT